MMKAARYYGPGDIRVEEIEEPATDRGQVKIKVAWNGISATDLHMFMVPFPLAPTATKANKLTGERLPITIGHELSGTIVEIGKDVDRVKWRIGQKVAVEPLLSCMKTATCGSCAGGLYNMCPKATFIGVGGRGGGLAEYISVDVRHVHCLPNGVSLELGAMLEPLAVAIHAVDRSGYKPGQSVLVSGAGPIGLLILKVLRSIDLNAAIIVSEPIEVRRKFASKCGATEVVDPATSQGIVSATVYGETFGTGVDIAFDAAGTQDSLSTALICIKPQGMLVNVAIWQQSPSVNWNLVNNKEIRLTGVMGCGRAYAEALQCLASGKITGLEDLVTERVALGAVVCDGILGLLTGKGSQVKILVHP